MSATNEAFINERNYLHDCYPNPVKDEVVFGFRTNRTGRVKFQLLNIEGKQIVDVLNKEVVAGLHHVKYNLKSLKDGTYIYRFQSGVIDHSKKQVKH